MTTLTQRELDVLAFARRRWNHEGAKETAIRELFDCSAVRYYQELNGLLDREEAYLHDPMLLKRLRRQRDERRAARTG
jgi:hypothetical protein